MGVNRYQKRTNSALDQLTMEELEQLLYVPDGEEPDVEFITEVLEVMGAKESECSEFSAAAAEDVDVDAAWNDFQENYMGHADAYERTFRDPDSEQSKTSDHSFLILLRRAVAVAAVLALLSVTAAASGFDLFKAIAEWTAETFQFAAPAEEKLIQAVPEDDPYQALRAAVAEETDLPVVPTWAPEEDMQESVTVTQRSNSVSIFGIYSSDSTEYTVNVIIYDDISSTKKAPVYQKDSTEIEKYLSNDIIHYIMSNNNSYTAVWANENVEVAILGDLTATDLRSMIDSVYWE